MRRESYAIAAAAAVLGQSFLFQPTQGWAFHLPQRGVKFGRGDFSSTASWTRSFSTSSSTRASLMTEGEVGSPSDASLPTSSNNNKGENNSTGSDTPLAEGSVVSFFRGGLAAVRIEEDTIQKLVLETTGVPVPAEVAKSISTDAGGDLTGHLAVFPSGKSGVVVAHRAPIAFVYGNMDTFDDKEGSVSFFKQLATRPIFSKTSVTGWDGQVVGAEATKANDGKDADSITTRERAIFAPIPQVKDIGLINNPMLTGNTMLDVLAPIGRGQNMLVVADDLSAARGMMMDFISTQKATKGVKFVYAAIDNSKDVLDRLRSADLMDDVDVVVPNRGDDKTLSGDVEEPAKAAEAAAIAASACAIAESFALEDGLNTVVIIDTLDQHKKLWDATTRTLVDIYGIDSVVKSDREGGASSEMRGFFSAIVQRAGQYKVSRGGGSVTILFICELPKIEADEKTEYSLKDFEGSSEKVRARIQLLAGKGVPLTPATLRKIDIPIPSASEGKRRLTLQHIDDLISMSDGQIWLDEALRKAGQCPPIDPQKSITRVGIGADTISRADAPAFRRITGVRLALSQAANMEGAEDTKASQKQARSAKALLLAMHQEEGSGGRSLADSCVAILAASNGFLDEAVDSGKLAGTEAGQQLVAKMLKHVKEAKPATMTKINKELDMDDSTQKELLEALESFSDA